STGSRRSRSIRWSKMTWLEQAVHNKLVALVLAMIVGVPLIAAPMEGSTPGLATMAFEGFAIVLLATLLWTSKWNLSSENVAQFLKTGPNTPILLFMLLVIVSCVLSPHKAYSIQETMRIGSGVLLYFVVAYQFRRSEYLTKLTDTVLFLAIASSLVGFLQFATGSGQYATGFFGDHQLFGSFLMILLPIVAVVAITETKQSRQLTAQVATVMTTACLLITHTRSAWIGAAAGLATLSVLSIMIGAKKGILKSKKHEVALPVMILLVAVGFFLIVSPQSNSILGRATTLGHVKGEKGFQYRENKVRGSIDMIKAHPLTGVGVGLYPYEQSAYTHSGNPLLLAPGLRASLGEQAHNLYLQTGAELGVLGLITLVSIPCAALLLGIRRSRVMDSGIRRSLLIGCTASCVAFAVDAIGSPAWQF